tara:strand:- start:427 stop:999 length:573 start_codon:yes stop_codon:yes gene_type:complete
MKGIVMKSFLAVMLVSVIAGAVEYKGVEYPATIELQGKTLTLNGLGLRTATFLNIKVYTIGLYVEKKSKDGKKIVESSENKEFRMQFLRDVDKGDIVDAWKESFKRHCSGEECKSLKPKLDELNALMQDMKEDHKVHYRMYGGKFEVVVNGKTIGAVEGEAFSKLLQKIWLADNSQYKEMRKGLLGLEDE